MSAFDPLRTLDQALLRTSIPSLVHWLQVDASAPPAIIIRSGGRYRPHTSYVPVEEILVDVYRAPVLMTIESVAQRLS